MPSKSDIIPINNPKLDRRVKLLEKDREDIKKLKGEISQRDVAKMFSVSRRTIQFIWFPEKLEENKKRRADRGGTKQYYDKEKHKNSMREHREYKKELMKEGKI